MDRDAQENVIRRAYAKQIVVEAGVSDRRIEAAFASVKREDFLGRGPWQVVRWGRGYVPTPSRNPVYLYDDVVVAIIPERHLNNGQPSLHATLIASAAPRLGEHIVHIGAGVGYYTAILQRLCSDWSVVRGGSRRLNSMPGWRRGSPPKFCGNAQRQRDAGRRCTRLV